MEYVSIQEENAGYYELVKKKRILLGNRIIDGEVSSEVATLPYNPKSQITLVIGPRGVGKTNVSKLVISQDINNFASLNNRKYLICDYKGIDWRTISRPQANKKALHPWMKPFSIEGLKPYTPSYDAMKAFEGDNIFGFAPTDFGLKDWMQVGKNMDTAAWQLKNLAMSHPEVLNCPQEMLNFIAEAAENMKQSQIYKTTYIPPATKNVLNRNLGILHDDKALVSIDSTYRQNYNVLEDLKNGFTPVMQFQKDETNPYVQFYSGKMLRDLYVARNNEWNQGRHDIGNVTVVIEEANVIFGNNMSQTDYPAVASIGGMIQQGRTLGFSLYIISQSLSSIHSIALENWNNLIIGANTGPADKEILKNMGVPDYLIEEIKNLKFNPPRGQFEFMYIGNNRRFGIKFNAAMSPVETAEEAV
jgi:hypothetical protein